jgi:hypothetical protein
VTVTITHAQRDALYDQILDRLSGIEDIWIAASTGRYETADRLGREYSDELRLMLDDLGWGAGRRVETIELATAPDVLRRIFGRLRETVADERAHRQGGWTDDRQLEERNWLVGEACQLVLEALGAEEPG